LFVINFIWHFQQRLSRQFQNLFGSQWWSQHQLREYNRRVNLLKIHVCIYGNFHIKPPCTIKDRFKKKSTQT
jgi:hypothetical protein